jgi:CHAD domain-containing protein
MTTLPAHAADHRTPELKPKDPLILLARRVLATKFKGLVEGLPSPGTAPHPEQVHELRIATRRLRVALRLFSGFMPDRGKAFRGEFRWLGRVLGELRDLDVYSARIAGLVETLPAESRDSGTRAAVATLQRQVASARSRARRKLNRSLETRRFRRLVGAFAEHVAQPPSPRQIRRWQSLTIADAAHGDLMQTLRRVRKAGRKIDAGASPEALHRLRIKVKRLRYEVEFYADFYPALRTLAKSAKRLQDFLGEHQDACIAAERLARHARALGPSDGTDSQVAEPSGEPKARRAIERLATLERENARNLRAGFSREWRRFEKGVGAAKLAKKRKT